MPICLGGNRRPRSRRPCVGERVSGILDRKGLMVRPGGITCTAPIIGALLRKSSGSIARGLWDRQPPHRMPPGARQRRRGKDFEAGLYSASLLNCLFLLMERYPRNPQYGPDFRRKISKKKIKIENIKIDFFFRIFLPKKQGAFGTLKTRKTHAFFFVFSVKKRPKNTPK